VLYLPSLISTIATVVGDVLLLITAKFIMFPKLVFTKVHCVCDGLYFTTTLMQITEVALSKQTI